MRVTCHSVRSVRQKMPSTVSNYSGTKLTTSPNTADSLLAIHRPSWSRVKAKTTVCFRETGPTVKDEFAKIRAVPRRMSTSVSQRGVPMRKSGSSEAKSLKVAASSPFVLVGARSGDEGVTTKSSATYCQHGAASKVRLLMDCVTEWTTHSTWQRTWASLIGFSYSRRAIVMVSSAWTSILGVLGPPCMCTEHVDGKEAIALHVRVCFPPSVLLTKSTSVSRDSNHRAS